MYVCIILNVSLCFFIHIFSFFDLLLLIYIIILIYTYVLFLSSVFAACMLVVSDFVYIFYWKQFLKIGEASLVWLEENVHW